MDSNGLFLIICMRPFHSRNSRLGGAANHKREQFWLNKSIFPAFSKTESASMQTHYYTESLKIKAMLSMTQVCVYYVTNVSMIHQNEVIVNAF